MARIRAAVVLPTPRGPVRAAAPDESPLVEFDVDAEVAPHPHPVEVPALGDRAPEAVRELVERVVNAE
jgi:hypothetical protein